MKVKIYIILLSFSVLFASCFKEDQPVPPYVPPENVESVSLEYSLYNHQIYFDLGSGTVMAENENSAWVLSFECGANGWHIRINSSDLWGVAHSGSVNFDSVFSNQPALEYWFDSSDGNPDSTAIGKWVDYNSGSPVYSNEVYLVGKYDGISYEPTKKVQFIHVEDSSYKIKVAALDETNADTIEIIKDDNYNSVHFSFNGNQVLHLEPEKSTWDIMFAQYSTILYTDDGVPTPYFVRGVLQNPVTVESALDTIVDFNEINYAHAMGSNYSLKQDAIGHDWKDVEVDEGSNTAEYTVRKGYTYIIRDTDQEIYKMRFKSYFNEVGIKGYPSFEYSKLMPE